MFLFHAFFLPDVFVEINFVFLSTEKHLIDSVFFLRNHDRIFAWILTQPKIFVGFKGMLNDVFETPGKLESLIVASQKKMPENRCLKFQEKDKLPWEPNDLLIFRGYNLTH